MSEERLITTAKSKSQPQIASLSPELLSACIHCGLCLPACPTYLATGRETDSPRGRIYLLNEWNEGRLPLNDRLTEHIDSCLGCLGCQTACPSGVQYEKILSQARPILVGRRPFWYRILMRTIFADVLPNYQLLKLLGSALRHYERLGVGRLWQDWIAPDANNSAPHLIPQKRHIFSKIRLWQEFLPGVPAFKPLPRRSWRSGAKAGPVQFFSGCVMDVFYNHVNHACMRLLAAQSHTVENPPQTCCGALAFHAGERDITLRLAKQNIACFEKTEGPIVVSAAGCGAMLKEYAELMSDSPGWAARAEDFSKRVTDITQSLNEGIFSVKPKVRPDSLPENIAYHAACHLAHAQKVHSEPLALLSKYVEDINNTYNVGGPGEIPAPVLVPLQDSEHCCGSAGIYNILHPDMSLEVLSLKMVAVEKSGAKIMVTTNPGCMLQLEAGARRCGLDLQVKHLAQVLDDFYCSET